MLDLPCGTGYLTTSLVDMGFEVTGADVSNHMLDRTKHAWDLACADKPDRRGHAHFVRQDIMHTDFPDGYYDAVVCNRLFHHFCEAETRRAALTELGRISRGPAIVFFFNRFALDTIRLFSLRWVFGRFRRGRIPIRVKTLAAEGAAAGLRLERVLYTRRGISPQCFAVFRPGTELPSETIRTQLGISVRLDPPDVSAAVRGPHRVDGAIRHSDPRS